MNSAPLLLAAVSALGFVVLRSRKRRASKGSLSTAPPDDDDHTKSPVVPCKDPLEATGLVRAPAEPSSVTATLQQQQTPAVQEAAVIIAESTVANENLAAKEGVSEDASPGPVQPLSLELPFGDGRLTHHSTTHERMEECLGNASNQSSLFIWTKFEADSPTHTTMKISDMAQRLLTVPNAGGASSVGSEVFSFELLHRLFDAILIKTEMEIRYLPGSKKTDYMAAVAGHTVGVSVTRAMNPKGVFSREHAIKLLEKKLAAVITSSNLVCHEDRWERQILHILCQYGYVAETLRGAYEELSPHVKGDTIVLVTEVFNCPWVWASW